MMQNKAEKITWNLAKKYLALFLADKAIRKLFKKKPIFLNRCCAANKS